MFSTPLDLGIFFFIGYLMSRFKSPSIFRHIIEIWPLQMLGLMSYSIYLWHGIVMKHFGSSFKIGPFEFFAYCATVVLISWFTYRYIEFGKERILKNLLPILENKS